MKKLLILPILSVFLLQACTPIQWDEIINDAADQTLNQTLVDTVPTVLSPNEILYDENGNTIPDFIPALQPFVNEGCNTAWSNLSGIVNPNGSVTYFTNLPDYTDNPTDYDKSRFTFIYQAKNPWFGVFEDEPPYAQIAGAGWYTLPIDDYGIMTCQGLQEIRIWVLDELTGIWYMNSQVCWAAVLCNGQGDCDQGYTFDQIEYTPYESGYIYKQSNSITNY
jgi:hypothetical protein